MSGSPSRSPGRVYGGRTEAERRADRRARLIAAGLELFGTEGWAATSIERLCAEANVATRSFYEVFTSREQVLLAVYEAIQQDAAHALLTALADPPDDLAARVRLGIAAYVGHHTDDPRRALVVHHEARVAGSLESHRRASMLSFADLVEHELKARLPARTEARRRVLAVALAAAVSEVLVDWVANPEPRPSTGPIIDELTALYVSALTRGEG